MAKDITVGTAHSTAPGRTKGTLKIAETPDGSPCEIPVIIVQGEKEGPTLWVHGCVHGNEYCGTFVIHEFLRGLDHRTLAGSVVALPVLQKLGFQSKQRMSPYEGFHGGDLNRQFPWSWVPGHEQLFPSLVRKLAPGGSLAVQMPDNLDEPAHRLLREVALRGPWAPKLEGVERTMRFGASWYYALLKPLCARVDVWRTIYHHPLAGADAVVEWFKGSALRPFLAELDDAEQQAFLQRYRDEIANAYPALADGTVLLPFPRLFIVATR